MTSLKNPNGKSHLAYIDGLRALSVFIILLFHLDVPGIPGGFVGVDVFFVISGFLITGIVARALAAADFSVWPFLVDFYARRIRRIFPALFAMLLLTSVAAIVFLGPAEYSEFFKTLRMASAQISNLYFAREQDYFSAGHELAPLLHTWSLGVEWQFYLIWPFLLMALHRILGPSRMGLALAGLCVLGLLVSAAMLRHDAVAAFYTLPARAWELALGGVLGLGLLPPAGNRRQANLLVLAGLGMIAAAALFYNAQSFPGFKALLPCLGAALVIHAAPKGDGMALRLLTLRPVVWLGLVSYSLYLWHWPLIAFYRNYFSPELSLPAQAALTGLSLLLAWGSYRLVEQPALRRRGRPGRAIMAGVMAIIIAIVGSNIIKNENKAGWRVTYALDETITSPNPLYDICAVEGGAFDRERCIIGPNKDAYEVILVGDSHAAHYIPTVLDWARERGLTARIFLRGACQTWVETSAVKMKAGKIDTYCTDLTRAFYETLKDDTAIEYVFLGLMQISDTPDIRASLDRVAGFGKKTVFLGRVPEFAHDPHHCQIRDHVLASAIFPRPERDCLSFDPEYLGRAVVTPRGAFMPLLKARGIAYFDPLPAMATAFDTQGRFMYMDTNHMNIYGAQHLSEPLSDFMRQQEKSWTTRFLEKD